MMRWYLYIPSVGFCFALGWVVWYLTKADKVKFIGIVAIVWTLYASISFERTLDWAKTSTFAEGLLAQVREQTQLTSPNDTLTFVTIPSRLKTTPLFHLGFEHTLRHSLRHDNVFVAFWPKIIMEEPGTVVAASLIPNENKILVSIDSLGYLFLDVEQFMTKRIAPEPGMKFKSGGISVELLEVTEDDKVLKFLFSTDWNLHRNLFFFDGQKFIRML
ncbi:MAG TPA: hypothetical protein VI704_06725 [Bacteroidota bacterium]|nr:hypothetical protein [Bacteroidota bacterium]